MTAIQRKDVILAGIDPSHKIIEIGPSYNPLTPKSEGWNTFSVDYATKEDLVLEYSQHNVDTSKIEDVDFVWKSGRLTSAVPIIHQGTFDVFLASHVIEHSTDVIGFLKSAEKLIKRDGRVILAIPDKRVCFDFYRYPSTASDAIRAHLDKRSRHSWKTFFDSDAYTTYKLGHPGWFRQSVHPMSLDRALSEALVAAQRSERADYVDAHSWIFTPSSFQLLIHELCELNFLSLVVTRVEIMPHTEFLVWLEIGEVSLGPEESNQRRVQLLENIILELEEQALQIDGSAQRLLIKRNLELENELKSLRDRLGES
ncbi:SAM-dependent methyltransferase [Methylobacterium brachiatum]|uniref:SAM-dependent methyltransferase n=1 Tax=Methylobacterium brachiatum TaxID=269660 RepID=A0AAJ1TQX9_9HYPH|nr:methyltransferase domain-containing protein [Methylobacterium brachiatum]MCB4804285.1 methyltransferase type 11 [Methylobacterium brachiatum]MDQ0545300.1 SAM-dependent methyltransferase [Methylobacterium brachiatum]